MNNKIVVIGASNIDIGGTPFNKLIRSDSNPGTVNIGYGGVGRNIAHNLSLLGASVSLISAAGNDVLGHNMISYCQSSGINTDHMLINENDTSPVYLYINNEKGDMELALSYIKLDSITPEYIDSVSDFINSHSMAVADANLSAETFLHIRKICSIPIMTDPVSQAHSSKIKGHLDGIEILKPNRLEAEYLTDIRISDDEDCVRAASSLLDQGVRNVFISMGSDGIITASDEGIYKIGCIETDIVSTTGAGDAASAAIVWSYTCLDDNPFFKDYEHRSVTAAVAANAAASITAGTHNTINDHLSSRSVIELVNKSDIIVTKLQ